MEARIIIPTEAGKRLTYDLRLHHSGGKEELKIVFSTSEEAFDRWLFYLLRDIGAHIVTDEPDRLRASLGLTASEKGVVPQDSISEIDVTRHAVKV